LGLLKADVYTKRAASRVLAQLGMLERGESAVSDRLAQDLLFFCAQCTIAESVAAGRLAAVRQVYGLDQYVAIDYETSHLGRFDPTLLTQARKRVVAAKDSWSAVAGGEMHRLASLHEQFSLGGLPRDLSRRRCAGRCTPRRRPADGRLERQSCASLAMEVATSVLYRSIAGRRGLRRTGPESRPRAWPSASR
jgi:chemosensory pili system protein ChpA (sensor histidine kinase/response regulator)